MKKILLLGDRGKIGFAMNTILGKKYEIIGKNTDNYNAFDDDETEFIINKVNPDVVLNCIGVTSTDRCEQNQIGAYKLNTLYPRLLAELSNKYGYTLFHFGTDAVFDGRKDTSYCETDIPNPLSVYSMTKLCGDYSILNICKDFYIFRLSLIFGYSPKPSSFVEHMLDKINKGERTLHIADDLVRNPTYNMDVAGMVKQFIEHKKEPGLYHVANKGMVSLYDMITLVVNWFGIHDAIIKPSSYKDFPFAEYKHTHTPLTSNKIKPMRIWEDALADYVNYMKGKVKGVG